MFFFVVIKKKIFYNYLLLRNKVIFYLFSFFNTHGDLVVDTQFQCHCTRVYMIYKNNELMKLKKD